MSTLGAEQVRASLTVISGAASSVLLLAGTDADALIETATLAGDTYADAAAVHAAEWYDDARDDAGAAGSFTAEPVEIPGPARYEALVRWGLVEGTSHDAQLALIVGGLQRIIANAHRVTVLENVARDPAGAKWARKARAGACEFCAMLATRGAAYTSKDAALVVGASNGGRVRGPRMAGQKYHDHCHCLIVPTWD